MILLIKYKLIHKVHFNILCIKEPVESPIFHPRIFFYEGSNSFVGQMNRRINNQPLNLSRAVNWRPLNTGNKQDLEAVCWEQATWTRGWPPAPVQLVSTNKRPTGRLEWPIWTPGSLNGSTLTGKSHRHPEGGSYQTIARFHWKQTHLTCSLRDPRGYSVLLAA